MVGMFFTTDVRYKLPRTAIKYSEAFASEGSTSESEDEPEVEGVVARPVVPPEVCAAYAAGKAARDAARETRNERRRRSNDRSRAKYREEEYLQRNHDLNAQKEHERAIFPMMWKRMSTDSQSRVKEENGCRTAYLTLDCVLPWTLIRRIHLTHMFGDTDPMKKINQHEQESKYGMMRQEGVDHDIQSQIRRANPSERCSWSPSGVVTAVPLWWYKHPLGHRHSSLMKSTTPHQRTPRRESGRTPRSLTAMPVQITCIRQLLES